MSVTFLKKLSRNDTGETNSHQVGICIPKKNKELLNFFPPLDSSKFNPDTTITCVDPEEEEWKMRYIYYNGKLTGQSTRDEYRITPMTKFMKEWNAKSNDLIMFSSTSKTGRYRIAIVKQGSEENMDFEPSLFNASGWSKAG